MPHRKQEILSVRCSKQGQSVTKFAGIQSPDSPDTTGIFQTILDGLNDVGLTETVIK